MIRNVLLAAVLNSCLMGGAALAQPKLDKSQLQGLEELERTLLYHPHLYGADHLKAFQKRGGKRVDYKTAQGKQTAWLMPETKGATPQRLWVICAGNGSLGLDLEPIARAAKFDTDAFLFVNYPGYGGLCDGKPSPQSIRENVKGSTLAAAKMTNIEPDALPDKVLRIRAFAWLLGSPAGGRGVSSPLGGVVRTVHQHGGHGPIRFGIPKTVPLPHSFDNRAGLRELAKNRGRAWIIHGDKDTIVPVDMSRTLAKEFEDTVTLSVIQGGNHGDIFSRGEKELHESMTAAHRLPHG